MKTWLAGIVLLGLLCPVAESQRAKLFAPQNAQTTPSTSPESQDAVFFSQFRSLLRQKSTVPPRLPTYFPRINPKKDLFAKVLAANADGYEVLMGLDPDCDGQTACEYGTLIGTTRAFDQIADLKGRQHVAVTLQNGITGNYYDAVCGGGCNDSMVAWTEGKYQYVLGLKGEEQAYVVKAANSAIAGPNAKPQ